MCLLLLSLLLAPRPAQAQSGGSWYAQPCDAQGNILSNPPYTSDGYVLTGPQTGTLSNTYPQPMINAALDYPSLYGDYLYAGDPLGIAGLSVSPNTVTFPFSPGSSNTPNDRVGTYTPDFAYALNYGEGGEGSYSIDAAHGGPSSGPINGSVTGDMSGQLVCYFKMSWSGPSPAPDHADFLLSTYVYAQASALYPPSVTTGLSATATASDDAFNETASASAGDGTSSGGVPEVDGHHLVRAAVDPQTMIAEVYLNGTAQWSISNMVPYLVPNPDRGGYTTEPAAAFGGSLVQAAARQDSREIKLSREGAHNETVDPDGTVHGDTTYSYYFNTILNNNIQFFHPGFGGLWSPNPNYTDDGTEPQYNISWKWDPQSKSSDFPDTWNSHAQYIDVGTLKAEGPPSAFPNYTWTGMPDAVKVVNISYTATDLGLTPNATAAANYVLSVHDQYDNWRRVDAQGNPLSGSAAGDPGDLTQIGQQTAQLQDVPTVNIEASETDWDAVGIVGGGFLSGGSIALLGLPDPPTWPIIILGLAGLGTTTVSSLPPPPPPTPVVPPDQINAGFLQQAYQNYESDVPGEGASSNLVDANLAAFLNANPDFQGYYDGDYGAIFITATVYQQMRNYYFYADEYDRGGLVAQNVPSTVNRPGDHVWRYLWTYSGSSAPPLQPGPTPINSNSPM